MSHNRLSISSSFPCCNYHRFEITLLLALLISFVFLANGCVRVKVEFIPSNTRGEAPYVITFTNASQNAHYFIWDFGDGTDTVTMTNNEAVEHSYTRAGNFTVTLNARKSWESIKNITTTAMVAISPGPLVDVAFEPAEIIVSPAEVITINANGVDEFGNIIPGLDIIYECTNEAGQISEDGSFTACIETGIYENAITVQAMQGMVTKVATANVIVQPGGSGEQYS